MAPAKRNRPRHEPMADSAMARRAEFVAEVARTISNRHARERESFVLGLSGKWGEGKTFFLSQLKHDLDGLGFEIVELNPWKYAADRVAFLRAFLVKLLEGQSKASRLCAAGRLVRRRAWTDAWMMLLPRRYLLDRLKTDVTRQRISIPRLLTLLLLLLTVSWLYSQRFASQVKPFVDQFPLLIGAVLVPLAIWLIQGLVNSQASSKAATAIDEFDRIASLALGAPDMVYGLPKSAWGVRDVVVFVDDLDRVTADVARGVLDNLRTFFDKPSLSFVVTGDHSVLEDSLGRELAPTRRSEQLEQGRRFMKKVFNLYWRLPKPVRSDFESFVDHQLGMRQVEIDKYIPRAGDQALLRQSLLDFCDTNLRLVIRTLDMLLFSLQLVKAQYEAANDEEKSSLRQVLDAPMLLSRVLLFQDRCTPLFDLLVESPGLLVALDRHVSIAKAEATQGGEQDPVAEFLKDHGGAVSLNAAQLGFLKRFAYQPPLFYDAAGGGQIVANPGPWLHLAGDLGFKDASGPTPDDFIRDTTNLNSESVSAAIAVCSESKADEVANAVINRIADSSVTTQIEDRVRPLLFLLKQCADAEPEARLAKSLVATMATWLDLLVDGVSEAQRADILVGFLACLDHQGSPLPDDHGTSMELRDPTTLPALPREAYGPLGSQLVVDWLTTYNTQNPTDCVAQLDELLPHVEATSLTRLADIAPQIASALVDDPDDGRRTQRAKVLHDFTPDGSALLLSTVYAALSREDIWQWADAAASEEPAFVPWAHADLRSALVDWVAAAPDAPQLVERLRYSLGKLNDSSDVVWRRLYAERGADLLGLLDTFAGEATLAGLEVPGDVATALYQDRARLVDEAPDEGQAIQLAGVLAPQTWLWTHVDRKSARAALRPVAHARALRHALQASVRPYWDEWA
jgi:hypothetical protein